jgi:hypothetical protein
MTKLTEEKGIITIYNLLLRTKKFVRSMIYGFKTIIVRREASLGPKTLARDRHFKIN